MARACVFFFGDSITFGMWDPYGGWASRVAGEIHARVVESAFSRRAKAYNLGLPGETSAGLVARLVEETRRRADVDAGRLFVVAIGINDADSETWSETSSWLRDYRDNLGRIARAIADLQGNVIFVGITPIDEQSIVPDTGKPRGDNRRNADIVEMNRTLVEFCAAGGYEVVPLYDEFMRVGLEGLLCDGLHPNQAGHQMISERVRGHVLAEVERIWAG